MDSLTQIVLGAAVGEVVLGKKVGNRAMLWGAIAGTIPDLDVFVGKLFVDPIDELAFHRGITHSIFFAVFFSFVLAFFVNWLYKNGYLKERIFFALCAAVLATVGFFIAGFNTFTGVFSLVMVGIIGYQFLRTIGFVFAPDDLPLNTTWKDWYKLFFWAVFTHPILDCFTVYGTQLFAPFSNYRVSWNVISVADPIYTIPFLICLIVASRKIVGSRLRKSINRAGIMISSVYLLICFFIKIHVNKVMESTLADQDISYKRYMTGPTILNSILWSGTVDCDSIFYQGQYSLFDKERTFKLKKIPQNRHLIAGHHDEKTLEGLKWFSNNYYGVMVRKDGRLQLNDLRYGTFTKDTEDEYNYIFRFVLEENAEGILEMNEADGGPPRGKEEDIFEALIGRIQGE